ncbi:hypothetical protein DL98DRAFT_523279, partial [Cadophora sp. DSE1049]
MNLLNISSHNFEITPPPLLSRCSLLHDATRAVKVDALAVRTAEQEEHGWDKVRINI